MNDFMTPAPDAIMAPSGPTWLDSTGIIITVITSPRSTLEDAIENIQISKLVGAGRPRPLLVDITLSRGMSKDVRAEYVKSQSMDIITSVALVTRSNVGRVVGNLFISVNKHQVPIKIFNDPHQAKEWLLQYT